MSFFASTLLLLAAASEPIPYSAPEAPHVDVQQVESPASEAPTTEIKVPETKPLEVKGIEHFTGKVTKDRVRLRLDPTLDAAIIKELPKNALVVATGSTDDFYAVLPQPGSKGYIFRTYVLDGEIVGNHVNVRLEPDTNAKIVCQLNSGDMVSGQPASTNNRWLEIDMPKQVRFYISKDYVSKIGPESLYNTLEAKMKKLQDKLQVLEKGVQDELKKPFGSIQLAPFAKELTAISQQGSDFPEQSQKAAALLKKMQEDYLEKSLNNKAEAPISAPAPKSSVKAEEIEDAAQMNAAQAAAKNTSAQQAQVSETAAPTKQVQDNEEKGLETLRGVIRPYVSLAKNPPGDFILVDTKTNLPFAFLASSQVNLANYIGKETTVTGIEKENNNFAYPAYTVLKAE